MTRSALKAEAPARDWWVGRCPECGSRRGSTEVGELDARSRRELEVFHGYVVTRETWPGVVKYQSHVDGCSKKGSAT